LEILVASDGSSDDTVALARRFENRGVRVLDYQVNRGKASVHNDAVREAMGDILLFTDAETIFDRDFIRNGIRWFRDERYGGGSGDLTFAFRDEIGKSENIYWKMEKV